MRRSGSDGLSHPANSVGVELASGNPFPFLAISLTVHDYECGCVFQCCFPNSFYTPGQKSRPVLRCLHTRGSKSAKLDGAGLTIRVSPSIPLIFSNVIEARVYPLIRKK